jgi:hypothetical protein
MRASVFLFLEMSAILVQSTGLPSTQGSSGTLAGVSLWEVVTAIGTSAAVVVALVIAVFHEHLRRLFWRPRLTIECINEAPDCHRTTSRNMATGQEVPCYYFRVRVINEGNAAAEMVEVSVDHIEQRRADGSFEIRKEFLPLNLLWAHIGQAYYPSIPPETAKHCDLGHILEPSKRGAFPAERHPVAPDNPEETLFCLDLVVRPNTGSFLLPPGVFRLWLTAVASNSRPTRTVVELNHTGRWFSDEARMLREGVGLHLC